MQRPRSFHLTTPWLRYPTGPVAIIDPLPIISRSVRICHHPSPVNPAISKSPVIRPAAGQLETTHTMWIVVPVLALVSEPVSHRCDAFSMLESVDVFSVILPPRSLVFQVSRSMPLSVLPLTSIHFGPSLMFPSPIPMRLTVCQRAFVEPSFIGDWKRGLVWESARLCATRD
jgi:hypothetical protein